MTVSPVAAGRGGSTGSNLRARPRMRSTLFSTSSSVTSAFGRSSSRLEKSIGLISGSSSSAIVYSRSVPSPNAVISILGMVAGRRPRSAMARDELSCTACSRISPITETP